MSLAMTRKEREAFLMDVHVGVIGIEREHGPPLTVPIWYDYRPDVGLWVITGRDSQKGRALARSSRFTLCAQVEQVPYKYVSVEGPVADVRETDVEKEARPMAHRYLGKEFGDEYVKSTPHEGSITLTMAPEIWRTVDYSKLGS